MTQIITNGHRRSILYGFELTEEERKEFDWLDNCDTLSWDDAEFFRYKGWVYCLSDIMRVDKHSPFYPNWDGYVSEAFFSGILVRYPKEEWGDYDTEHIIVGSYYS